MKNTSQRKPFECKPPEVHFSIRSRVPYNKQVTNRACSSSTGEHWPSVVAVLTSLRWVLPATTLGQCSPVRSSRSVSKQLIFNNYSLNREIEKNYCFSTYTQGDLNKIREETIKKYDLTDRSNHALV